MLPSVIHNIINDYKTEFERVEAEIQHCIEKYYEIENKVEAVRQHLLSTEICHYHRNSVCESLTNTIVEAARIMDRILEDETVNPIQTILLSNLENNILVDVVDIICQPLMLYPAFL